MRIPLGTDKNGVPISFDMSSSHAVTHVQNEPGLIDHIHEALQKIEIDKNKMVCKYTVDLGRELGETDLTKTGPNDEITYAIREGRDNYARFVHGKKRKTTTTVAIILKRMPDGTYELYSGWHGVLSPPFPGTEHSTDESMDFWMKHALVWGRQAIIDGTETTECPW